MAINPCAAMGVLMALAVTACDRREPLVICHNANCAEPTDVAEDDTLPALRASLALRYQGRPILDGVEMDSFWRGSDEQCIFAHDLETVVDIVPATAPATELAMYFAQPGPIAWRDDIPFEVLLELKSAVSAPPIKRHTPAQRAAHAACAWDMYKIIADAAVANNRNIRITFSAFAPELLRAVLDGKPAATPVDFRLEGLQGIPAPLDAETRPLGDYHGLPIDIFEFHAHWITDAQHEAALSLNAELSLFMFDATVETFAAIRQYQPTSVVTSEARLLRRWVSSSY